jgi:hypothetical protein
MGLWRIVSGWRRAGCRRVGWPVLKQNSSQSSGRGLGRSSGEPDEVLLRTARHLRWSAACHVVPGDVPPVPPSRTSSALQEPPAYA